MEKVYMCGPFGKKAELKKWGEYLEQACGVEIVSRWLNGSHGSDQSVSPFYLCQVAYDDIEDIERCDIVVAMIGQGGVSGGRHWECGYAQALGKLIILVGQHENIFHHTCSQCATIELAADMINHPLAF